jgi:hypothetical protein
MNQPVLLPDEDALADDHLLEGDLDESEMQQLEEIMDRPTSDMHSHDSTPSLHDKIHAPEKDELARL